MPLSQSCQAKLGLTKVVRKGTVILEDYGEELEIVRHAGTGLFMFRIDPFLADGYMGGDPRLEELLTENGVGDSDLDADHIGGRDDSPAKRVGFPASSGSHKDPESVRDHRNERIVIVSRGAHNFELTSAA